MVYSIVIKSVKFLMTYLLAQLNYTLPSINNNNKVRQASRYNSYIVKDILTLTNIAIQTVINT